MGFGSCACPLPAALTTIPALTCGEDFGQIQKIVVQRRQTTPSFPTMDATAGGAAALASWSALLAATNSTKVVTTPFVESLVIPQGTAIMEGGDDNSTIDGNPIVVGASSIAVTGMFRSLPANILRVLKELNCELDLSVFLINEYGKIIGENPSTTLFTGIPITSFFVGDPGNEGKNTNDKTPINFNFRYGWRDRIAFVTPSDFNARFDL